jgi:hypothetical protein
LTWANRWQAEFRGRRASGAALEADNRAAGGRRFSPNPPALSGISDGEVARSGPALRSLGHPLAGVGSESPTVHILTPNASRGTYCWL